MDTSELNKSLFGNSLARATGASEHFSKAGGRQKPAGYEHLTFDEDKHRWVNPENANKPEATQPLSAGILPNEWSNSTQTAVVRTAGRGDAEPIKEEWRTYIEAGAELNGIPFTMPESPSYEGVNEALEMDEDENGFLERAEAIGKAPAAGVVLIEPDGRIWVVEPTDHFAGVEHTFPKGKKNPGETLQRTALKELFEEAGLEGEIVGLLGDYEKTTSLSRYYVGRRTGGNPSLAHWETQSVRLAPQADLPQLLNVSVDRTILADVVERESGLPTPRPKTVSKNVDVKAIVAKAVRQKPKGREHLEFDEEIHRWYDPEKRKAAQAATKAAHDKTKNVPAKGWHKPYADPASQASTFGSWKRPSHGEAAFWHGRAADALRWNGEDEAADAHQAAAEAHHDARNSEMDGRGAPQPDSPPPKADEKPKPEAKKPEKPKVDPRKRYQAAADEASVASDATLNERGMDESFADDAREHAKAGRHSEAALAHENAANHHLAAVRRIEQKPSPNYAVQRQHDDARHAHRVAGNAHRRASHFKDAWGREQSQPDKAIEIDVKSIVEKSLTTLGQK